MRAARVVLAASGIGLVGFGVVEAARLLEPGHLVGLALWLAAALVLHDGLVAPATAVVSRALERHGTALSPAARGVVRVGLVVGGVLTLVVVPEIVAQARGNPNPTVLQGAYATRLAWTWVVIGVLTVAGAAVAQRAGASRRADASQRAGAGESDPPGRRPRRPTVRGS